VDFPQVVCDAWPEANSAVGLIGVRSNRCNDSGPCGNEARVMLVELLDRIEPNPTSATAGLHHSTRSSSAATGDEVATPRGFEPLLQP
jgi:hypothetical protein